MLIEEEIFGDALTLTAVCSICEKVEHVTVGRRELDRYMGGELVQNVWPDLSADERELIISARTPTPCSVCWDKYMRCEEDE